jgi:hypothetical protein
MNDLIGTDDPFEPMHRDALKEILGFMIPARGSRPAANDAAIFDDFIATAKPHAPLMLEAIDLLQRTSSQDSSQGSLQDSLQHLSQSKAPAVTALVSFVVQCYYRDDRVMAALEMEPRPPHPLGFELEEGDWTLLDPVRARGKIYRDI